ncbi:hypothetical protein PAPYR_1933 [Paratrimastix pyriformis]|uniref:Uncharacterized protein n=1 Tax=Paratrimastix pyriformis TaxID=342808 RepID=A0ABQ8URM8_9EUKA|nr:hypothetical protein PAPYR_1933 [Paratrimastix pyriformis]
MFAPRRARAHAFSPSCVPSPLSTVAHACRAAAAQQVQPCGLHTPLDLHLPPSRATSGSTRGNFFASMPPFHGSSSGRTHSAPPADSLNHPRNQVHLLLTIQSIIPTTISKIVSTTDIS